MCKRVYTNYGIKVKDENGEKFIKINGNVNTTNYSTMVKTYHMTKERYSESDCIVSLVGIYNDGVEGKTIFEKEFKSESTTEDELLTTTDDIVSNIKHNLSLLVRKKQYHKEMNSMYDKKEQLLLHKIETIKAFKGSKEDLINEKLKIFDEIEANREERRFTKEEISDLNSLFGRINIDNIIKEFDKVRVPIDGEHEYIDEVIEEKIIKEYPYRTDKERISLMSQLKPKYDKVVVDEVGKKIICSNKGYHKNKLK